MTDLSGGFDLTMLRGDNDVAAGFNLGNGIYQMEVSHPQSGEQVKAQMPVLDLVFHMANGKSKTKVSISPDMVLPMIAAISGWKLNLDQQVASPPVPPGGVG